MRWRTTAALWAVLAAPSTAQQPPARPAPAPKGESPIDFVVGNEVVTRAQVLKRMGQSRSRANRQELYKTVRLQMAQDSLLYQQALHVGIRVAPSEVRALIADEIRRAVSAGAWWQGVRDLRGVETIAEYQRLRMRDLVVGRFARMLSMGPEFARGQVPLARVLFTETRLASIKRYNDLHPQRQERPGELWEASVRPVDGADPRAVATQIAELWNDAAALSTVARSPSEAELRHMLAQNAVPARPLSIDIYRLDEPGAELSIFDRDKANVLYHAVRRLTEGEVSPPIQFGDSWYIFKLVNRFRSDFKGIRELQNDIRDIVNNESRNRKLKVVVREALRTVYVHPADLRRALLKHNRREDSKSK